MKQIAYIQLTDEQIEAMKVASINGDVVCLEFDESQIFYAE